MQSNFPIRDFVAQDRAVTIVAADLNPAMINPDILRYSGVIPTEWVMKKTPTYTPGNVHIAFTNGVNILAQGHQVIFVEPFEIGSQITQLAQQFIRAFPNLDYKGSTLNLRGYLPTDYPPGHYISDKWLAKGPWQDDCARAALNLVYPQNATTENAGPSLELALTEAMIKTREEQTVPIVLFSGRYGYAAKGETNEEVCRYLSSKLAGIKQDVAHYIDIVEQKFVQTATQEHITRELSTAG